MKSVGEIRVSPSVKPSRNRFHNSVMSASRAPQISANSGRLASAMVKFANTGISASSGSLSSRTSSA
ncbi:MAG: hypothetical protein ACD_54C00865G0002 [uncultured bacterium]|nr:MAG: hypothetical protein ACD_54C00865G0002 [uncultured bacterium]